MMRLADRLNWARQPHRCQSFGLLSPRSLRFFLTCITCITCFGPVFMRARIGSEHFGAKAARFSADALGMAPKPLANQDRDQRLEKHLGNRKIIGLRS